MELIEIQRAIRELPQEQKAALGAWLSELNYAEWDDEIERDFAAGGAGMPLLEQMKVDARAGRFAPFGKNFDESP